MKPWFLLLCSISVGYSGRGKDPRLLGSLDVGEVVADLAADLFELLQLALKVHPCILLLLKLLLQRLELRDPGQARASLAKGAPAHLGPEGTDSRSAGASTASGFVLLALVLSESGLKLVHSVVHLLSLAVGYDRGAGPLKAVVFALLASLVDPYLDYLAYLLELRLVHPLDGVYQISAACFALPGLAC